MSEIVPAWFVNRDNGLICHVLEVNDGFARYVFDYGNGTARVFSMPIAQYDEEFVKIWRPATPADLARETNPGFRLPANAPADWRAKPQTS